MILKPARLTLDIESMRMVEMETDIKNGCKNMKSLKYESDFPQHKMVSIKCNAMEQISSVLRSRQLRCKI